TLIAFNEPTYILPGVFEGAPERGVNGSLWTLPYEIGMYFVVFVMFYSCRSKPVRITLALFFLVVSGTLILLRDFHPEFNLIFNTWNWFATRPLGPNAFMFSLGVIFHLVADKNSLKSIQISVFCVFVLLLFGDTSVISAYLLIGFLVLRIGESRIF